MARKRPNSFDILSGFDGYAPGWSGMFILLGLLLAGALLGNGLVFLLMFIPGLRMGMSEVTLVTYPLMFVPPMLYASVMSRKAFMLDRSRPEDAVDSYRVESGQISTAMLAFMCAAATAAAAIVTEPLVKLIPTTGPVMGPFYESIKAGLEALTRGPLWISLLCTAVFAPVFEEWLCRGMVLRGLLRKTSPAVAIMVSGAFFALIHFNPWQAVPAFVLGCLFGIVYYKTGSLKLTMLMHCVNNTISVCLSQIPAFQDKEYLCDIITDRLQYGLVYLCALAMCALFVARVLKLRQKQQ